MEIEIRLDIGRLGLNPACFFLSVQEDWMVVLNQSSLTEKKRDKRFNIDFQLLHVKF